jgi:methyl-accepting chemotaxis protein
MALTKRSNLGRTSSVHDDDADASSHRRAAAQRDAPVAHQDGTVVSLAANSALAEAQKRKARTFARQQKAAERIAAATSELASGITEASAAATEMRKASDQIASGAEEAAGASQESLKAVNHGAALIFKAKDNADNSVSKTEALQTVIVDVARQISNSIQAIGRTSERQEASVKLIQELERQAATISEVVKAVARIADQTNLLALNAAIEAARAGQHGRGFAVVADEVRTLAETSEKSARDIQELIVQIQKDVKVIAEGIQSSATAARDEMVKGKKTTETLEQVRGVMSEVIAGSREIARGAEESTVAAREAQKGSEVIAAAAEEQGSACEEARKTVDQQALALTQSEQTAQELSELAEELKNSTDISKSAEEVASAAEELSSAVEEINRAAAQIMTALDQIGKGAQQQSAASQESAAAIAQIERGAQMSLTRAQAGMEKAQTVAELLEVNKATVDELIAGVTLSVEAGRMSREQITALEQISRRIDKIVDAIATVSIQTNMLAVNGSVEAARAGEFGKGFAVVSTDIRNLARDSAENADRIKDTVKAIQDQIVTVRADLGEIVEASVIEAEKEQQIAAGLETVAHDMAAVLTSNKDILAGSDEILRMTKEVQVAAEQVAAAAQEADRASSEAADAAKEQAKGTSELASAVEEIASLADELQAAA